MRMCSRCSYSITMQPQVEHDKPCAIFEVSKLCAVVVRVVVQIYVQSAYGLHTHVLQHISAIPFTRSVIAFMPTFQR